jgi:lipoyl-dependent peroxiredoxin subunit D
MEFLISIKEQIPDFAKDIRLNIDSVIARSPLRKDIALGCTLAASVSAKNKILSNTLINSNELDELHINAALTAASLMGMNNTWYPFVDMSGDNELKNLPAGLRMNAYASHGGIEKNTFEMFALAASVVGKCHFCVESHYSLLKSAGIGISDLKEIGKIAAVVVAITNIMSLTT